MVDEMESLKAQNAKLQKSLASEITRVSDLEELHREHAFRYNTACASHLLEPFSTNCPYGRWCTPIRVSAGRPIMACFLSASV